MTTYQLWDTASRNLVDEFGTKAELLAALRQISSMDGLRVAVRSSRGKTAWVSALDFAVTGGVLS